MFLCEVSDSHLGFTVIKVYKATLNSTFLNDGVWGLIFNQRNCFVLNFIFKNKFLFFTKDHDLLFRDSFYCNLKFVFYWIFIFHTYKKPFGNIFLLGNMIFPLFYWLSTFSGYFFENLGYEIPYICQLKS